MVASLSLDTPFEKISRYRETNTFYRQPLVESYPRMGEIREEESTPDSHLPGSMYVSDNSGPDVFLKTELRYCGFLKLPIS